MNETGQDGPEVPSLEELDQAREGLRKRMRPWHLFTPLSGDDLRSYRRLLIFVRPYRSRMLLSVLLAAVAAIFLAIQLGILDYGLASIFGGGGSGELTATPDGQEYVVYERRTVPKIQPMLDFFGLEDDSAADPGQIRTEESGKYYMVPPSDQAEQTSFNEQEIDRRQRQLWLMAFMLVIAVVLQGIGKYSQTVLMGSASRNVVVDLRMALFRHVLNLSVRFHQRNHSAKLVSRLTHDLEIFGRFLTEVLVRIVQSLFEFAACVTVIVLSNGSFIFIVAGIVAIGIAPVQIIGRRLRKQDKNAQMGMAEIYASLSEAFTGQRVIKAFSSEERECENFRGVARAHLKRVMRMRRLRSLTEPVVMTLGSIGTAAIIVVGGSRVLHGQIEASSFMVMIIAIGKAMTAMRVISKQLTDFQIGLAAADRVGLILGTSSEIKEKDDAIDLPPFQRDIRFENVQFRHAPGKPTLRNIDLTIRRGERIALVGSSGAGKSTIADLLPRFFDVGGGRITIDGHDLRDLTIQSLRDQIGIVAQETILFRGTIRTNISYGRPDATLDEVKEARASRQRA